MIMSATKLVSGNAKPTDAQIDAALGNICACGTYPRVKQAIKKATGQ
jgi:isoquinoline 1-oxidoreductase alpha subunit